MDKRAQATEYRKTHTIQETAEKFGVSTATVYNWTRKDAPKKTKRKTRTATKLEIMDTMTGMAMRELKYENGRLNRIIDALLANRA